MSVSGKKLYKSLVLELVEERCPNKKKPMYSNGYYFDKMILVLKDVTSWKSLGKFFGNKKYHYKTIQDKYLQWCGLNIFEDAYIKGISTVLNKYNSHSTIDLFIDTASINNKYGVELVAYGQNKKKKISKISLICNINKIPLSVTAHKGSVHDVKTIDASVNKLIENLKYRRINLVGDKGYIAKQETKDDLLSKGIKLITPYRKNQKKKNCKRSQQKLNQRYVVEHSNQKMKDFNRVYVRRDRLIKTYLGFVYIALAEKYIT